MDIPVKKIFVSNNMNTLNDIIPDIVTTFHIFCLQRTYNVLSYSASALYRHIETKR